MNDVTRVEIFQELENVHRSIHQILAVVYVLCGLVAVLCLLVAAQIWVKLRLFIPRVTKLLGRNEIMLGLVEAHGTLNDQQKHAIISAVKAALKEVATEAKITAEKVARATIRSSQEVRDAVAGVPEQTADRVVERIKKDSDPPGSGGSGVNLGGGGSGLAKAAAPPAPPESSEGPK